MTATSARASRVPIDVGIDGPDPRDLLRAFVGARADPLALLSASQRRYGDLVAFPVPGPPVLLVNDPDGVRQVLHTGARHWTKDTLQYSALARVTGAGLLASDDPSWLEHRRTAGPAFHHGRLDEMTTQVREAARDAIRPWAGLPAGGAVVDVAPLCLQLALDVVGRTLFSTDLTPRARTLLTATSRAAELIVATGRSFVPFPAWVPTRTRVRLRAANRDLDALCEELIVDRRRRDAGPGDDFLGLLLAGGLSDREVRDELVTMVVAGHETVAATLAWTLMLLAENPLAQQRVRDEVAAAGPVSMVATSAATPWTRAVVDESLRLCPPAWVISRRSSQPDVVAGHAVPAGTTVIISPWLIHRRAESWPDPTSFRPDRFLDGPGTRARSDYLPFGLGPRLCIGREFALGEMVIALSELLRDHRVTTTSPWRRPAPKALVAVHPRGGMRLRVEPVRRGTS